MQLPIRLLPGVYRPTADKTKPGLFKAELKGSAEKPIIIRAVAGKRVTLDGWMEVHEEHTTY